MGMKSWIGLVVLAVPLFGTFVWMCKNDGTKPSTCSTANLLSPDGSPTSVLIDYSTYCTRADGCRFDFSCKNKGNLQSYLYGLEKKFIDYLQSDFEAYADENNTQQSNLDESVGKSSNSEYPFSLFIDSLETIEMPAILQISPNNVADTNLYKKDRALPCKYEGSSIRCITYAPIADHVLLQGKLDGRPVKLDIKIDTSFSDAEKADANQVKVCGQLGIGSENAKPSDFSTLQRMYDCSKQNTLYGGHGDYNGGVIPFVLGTSVPSANWFLVACPVDGNREKCSFLSPVFTADNPLVARDNPDLFLTSNDNSVQVPGKKMSELKNKRVLWSGILEGEYNFFQANGHIKAYDYYKTTDNEEGYENGQRRIRSIYYSKACAPIKDNNLSSCNKRGSGREYEKISEELESDYNAEPITPNSVCVTAQTSDPALISDAKYSWQVPSYPVLLSLTGGVNADDTENICEDPGDVSDGVPIGDYCLSYGKHHQYGFRAVNKFPGFITRFWSSSVREVEPGNMWTGGGGSGLFYAPSAEPVKHVRCMSADW